MPHTQEDDYEVITNQYKSAEGSLAERMAVIKALRQSGGLWASNRFPAAPNEDMFYQMTDLDKGTYGKPYQVSLFLHVSGVYRPTLQFWHTCNYLLPTKVSIRVVI